MHRVGGVWFEIRDVVQVEVPGIRVPAMHHERAASDLIGHRNCSEHDVAEQACANSGALVVVLALATVAVGAVAGYRADEASVIDGGEAALNVPQWRAAWSRRPQACPRAES